MGNFLSTLIQVGAPLLGSLFGPAGAAIGGAVGQLFGNWGAQQAASEAEMRALQRADAARQLAMQTLGDIRSGGSIRQMVSEGLGLLGGGLGASGLTGSTIGNRAARGVVSDVVARIAPQIQQNQINATRLAMDPDMSLFEFYGKGAETAAGAGGFDFSNLPLDSLFGLGTQLLGMLFGGGTPRQPTRMGRIFAE